VRAYLRRESLEAFWRYTTVGAAGGFLDKWCTRALRSRLDPIKKFARSLRRHRDLILNWFVAKKEISAAAVEGLNANAKLALRKARGFAASKSSKLRSITSSDGYPSPADHPQILLRGQIN
jgi:transposase